MKSKHTCLVQQTAMAGISECETEDKGNAGSQKCVENGHLNADEQMKQANGESKFILL